MASPRRPAIKVWGCHLANRASACKRLLLLLLPRSSGGRKFEEYAHDMASLPSMLKHEIEAKGIAGFTKQA